MKKYAPLLFTLLFYACAGAPEPIQGSYFVAASGSDRNDGRSEASPFRSLFKAMTAAAQGSVKTITVIGTLDAASEQSSNKDRVFFVQAMGQEPVLIRGSGEGAALSAAGSGRRTVLVRGTVPIRFENIEISGGESFGEGGGMVVGPGSQVILGSGAVVKNNRSENLGGGVMVVPGASLLVEGGKILDNRSAAGGGVAAAGTGSVLVIRDGELSGNHSQGGGGAAVYQGSSFVFSGGIIGGNYADVGGGVMVNQEGSFTMDGGMIRENRSVSGGGIALLEKSSFTLINGEIRGNVAAEHGGGVASDSTGTVNVQGGFISANRAGRQGGGVFTAGGFVKSGGKIYGSDAPGEANTAAAGAAIYIFRDGQDKTRQESAGEDLVLDAASNEGWIIRRE